MRLSCYLKIRAINQSLFLTTRFYSILFSLSAVFYAYSEQTSHISKDVHATWELDLQSSLKTAGPDFEVKNGPYQNLDNQPTSSAAYSTDFISSKVGFFLKDKISLHVRADYALQIPIQLGLYPVDQAPRSLILKDLYLKIPSPNSSSSIWIGRRTFQFEPIALFQAPNPFDQLNLQGGGIEFEKFQTSASINQANVSTIATNQNQNFVLDTNGNPILYQRKESIASIFISGNLILSEGKSFQPIAVLRYYLGNASNPNENGVQQYSVNHASSFIIGGVFSHPISNGVSGSTTLWFDSLPSDKPIDLNSISTNGRFNGVGRIPFNYPRNAIGISDSSEFQFSTYGGILTALVFTNNTYSSILPILHPTSDNMSLIPDGNLTSIHSNKVSLGLEPIFFVTESVHTGIDLNYAYVTPKLFASDANALIITPLIRYAFDKKLMSKQYAFVSGSYGFYDWKIKTYSNGSQTDKLFSMQAGVSLDY